MKATFETWIITHKQDGYDPFGYQEIAAVIRVGEPYGKRFNRDRGKCEYRCTVAVLYRLENSWR